MMTTDQRVLRGRLGISVAGLLWLICVVGAKAGDGPLELVDEVDLERYQGRWYEIALLPNRFQRQCAGETTAEYSLMDNGRVSVLNRCRNADGDFEQARGVAKQPDPERPARLKVRFGPRWLGWLPLVWGDYQIIALDDAYRWVMVGAPSRKYLWILAREPELDPATLDALLEQAEQQGFPVKKVRRSRQDWQ